MALQNVVRQTVAEVCMIVKPDPLENYYVPAHACTRLVLNHLYYADQVRERGCVIFIIPQSISLGQMHARLPNLPVRPFQHSTCHGCCRCACGCQHVQLCHSGMQGAPNPGCARKLTCLISIHSGFSQLPKMLLHVAQPADPVCESLHQWVKLMSICLCINQELACICAHLHVCVCTTIKLWPAQQCRVAQRSNAVLINTSSCGLLGFISKAA